MPKDKDRPEVLSGRTAKVKTPCGALYITVNKMEGKPWETFAMLGKSGACAKAMTEAIGRLISNALQAGVDPSVISRSLAGIRCADGESCPAEIGKVLSEDAYKSVDAPLACRTRRVRMSTGAGKRKRSKA